MTAGHLRTCSRDSVDVRTKAVKNVVTQLWKSPRNNSASRKGKPMIVDNEWGFKLGAPKVLASATFGRQQPLYPGVAPSLQVRAADDMSAVVTTCLLCLDRLRTPQSVRFTCKTIKELGSTSRHCFSNDWTRPLIVLQWHLPS